ncbi:MAG TPA: PEGA domain-containing protein [Myxococcaceae bacterium]|nr:PEGA domain-containing protein [Myxococcaceae bacterium]
MSQPPDEDEDQIFSGNALSEDGAVKPAPGSARPNQMAARPTRSPPPGTRPPSPPARPPAPPMPGASLLDDPAWEPAFSAIPPRDRSELSSGLELAERAPPPASSDFVIPRREKPPRFTMPDVQWGKWIFRLVLLGVLGGGVWVVVTGKVSLGKFSVDLLKPMKSGKSKPAAADQEESAKSRPAQAPSLLVLSEPSGATVLVGGTEVGVTPWAGDNVWPAEPLKIEVRKAGYRPWVGMTVGGKQATLEASLKRR